MTTPTQKIELVEDQFIVDLTDAAKNHTEWFGIVQFGLNQLLERQHLFAEVIMREAQKMAERDARATVTPSDFIAQILQELKLKLTVAGGEQK